MTLARGKGLPEGCLCTSGSLGSLCSPSPVKPATLACWAGPAPAAGGQVPRWEGAVCGGLLPLLSDSPLCASGTSPSLGREGLPLVFGPLGALGSHFCHGRPEPSTLPWVPFMASSLVTWLSPCCSLSPALYSFQHASSFLGEHSPGGQRSCRGGKEPVLPAWAAWSPAMLVPCPSVTARGLPLPASSPPVLPVLLQ